MCFFIFQLPAPVYIACIVGLVAAVFAALFFATHILRVTKVIRSNIFSWLGAFVVVGGAVFDIYATILFSPTLDLESNPVVRFLLKHDVAIEVIYWAGGVMQLVFVSIVVMMWLATVSGLPSLLSGLHHLSGNSLSYAILAGEKATLGSMLAGRGDVRYTVSFLSAMLIGVFVYRWYLGLEWFRIVPISRRIAPVVIFLGTAVLYVACCHKYVKKAQKK